MLAWYLLFYATLHRKLRTMSNDRHLYQIALFIHTSLEVMEKSMGVAYGKEYKYEYLNGSSSR